MTTSPGATPATSKTFTPDDVPEWARALPGGTAQKHRDSYWAEVVSLANSTRRHPYDMGHDPGECVHCDAARIRRETWTGS